ncbi:MAG: flagellar basal-body MS-ring/collar protein FliF [Anaerolineaceae bacterium]
MLNNLASQASNFWQRQKTTQRIILISVVAVMAIIVPVLINWASQTSYSVAFSGLAEEDASSIVESLQSSNIPYQLKGTGTILVPAEKVYDVRLSMAGEGLPKGSSTGFELFTGSTIGMTEFTQRVNYQQAMEGELERTIGSLEQIAAVRVHIVTPEKSLLVSEQTPTTASITIEVQPGQQLDGAVVRAITYLVANAVEGLKPENVVVVDTNGELLASGTGNDGLSGSIAQLDSRRAAELAVSSDLQKKVRNLLDIALGPNRSVVQVSVALDWSDKEITKQSFDPTPIAILSSQKSSESYVLTDGTTAGVPGATTNLPETATGETTAETTNPTLYTKTDETTNYEVATTQSHEIIHPGQIQLVALSVLVDGVTDQEQLAKLETAISAAVGINAERGDQLSVQTLAFDKTYAEAQAEDLSASERTKMYILIGEIVAVIVLLGLLLWYVMRLLRNLRMASVEVWDPVLKPMNLPALTQRSPSSAGDMLQLSQAAQQGLLSGDKAQTVQSMMSAVARPAVKLPTISVEDQKMQQIVQRMAEDNPSNVAEIIQMWLSQDKTNNG